MKGILLVLILAVLCGCCDEKEWRAARRNPKKIRLGQDIDRFVRKELVEDNPHYLKYIVYKDWTGTDPYYVTVEHGKITAVWNGAVKH